MIKEPINQEDIEILMCLYQTAALKNTWRKTNALKDR